MPLKNVSEQSYKVKIRTFGSSLIYGKQHVNENKVDPHLISFIIIKLRDLDLHFFILLKICKFVLVFIEEALEHIFVQFHPQHLHSKFYP